MNEELITLPLELVQDSLIKVVGVGGGGGNAVNYLYEQGIQDVTFLVCNTDRQAMSKLSVPAKLQLGTGLGAGGKPEVACLYAEQSRDAIKTALDDGTKMLFVAAGMGGGTGTGASPIVAEVAQEMGILTVGIVTIPFKFEKGQKIHKAMVGVAKLAKHVDALLIINNEKLKDIYPDFSFLNAFEKSNDVVANAARAIAEIITLPGIINTDFADVYNTLKDGGVAIMNVGRASGETRITDAINDALNSPLVNTNDVHGAKRLLLQLYCSTEHAIQMQEIDQIDAFVDEIGDDVEVQWGAALDETLGDEVRVTIIATGYEVDGLPTIDTDDEEQSIQDAIRQNYETPEKRKDDEPTVTIDLKDTLQAVGTSSVDGESAGEPKWRNTPSADEVVIHIDDDVPTAKESNENTQRRWGGWLRR
ncbi:MAG: cell division protein FtsZ [Paludibacteraceae bacterium]|nr:cell division protein FtsZ [Paludibacteraceae bacterium]